MKYTVDGAELVGGRMLQDTESFQEHHVNFGINIPDLFFCGYLKDDRWFCECSAYTPTLKAGLDKNIRFSCTSDQLACIMALLFDHAGEPISEDVTERMYNVIGDMFDGFPQHLRPIP